MLYDNIALEFHKINSRIDLQKLLDAICNLQLNLYREQDWLKKESKTYLKDWESLQRRSVLLELAKLNILKAIRELDYNK